MAGEKPGKDMTTPDELKASGSDRSRMKTQKKSASNKQGGRMSDYSKAMNKKYGI